jgi:predicted NBD/HSP70 family sugar kinase
MYIIADIGGTKMRLAKSDDLESFADPVILNTPQQYGEGITELANTARTLAGSSAIEGMMIAIRGIVSSDNRQLLQDPVLVDWAQKPLAADLEGLLNARVVHIENDTAIDGLGEAIHGAGKGADICVYITVSTGVNGTRVVDGKIDASSQGFEIGGQYLSMGNDPQTLEDLVSGRAVAKRFGVGSPKDLGKDNPAWEELAHSLAFGVHNTILHWSPDRVVLGGSMFNEIGISVERVHAHVSELMKKFPIIPEIVHSGLGDLGGLYGGMVRLKQLR